MIVMISSWLLVMVALSCRSVGAERPGHYEATTRRPYYPPHQPHYPTTRRPHYQPYPTTRRPHYPPHQPHYPTTRRPHYQPYPTTRRPYYPPHQPHYPTTRRPYYPPYPTSTRRPHYQPYPTTRRPYYPQPQYPTTTRRPYQPDPYPPSGYVERLLYKQTQTHALLEKTYQLALYLCKSLQNLFYVSRPVHTNNRVAENGNQVLPKLHSRRKRQHTLCPRKNCTPV